MTSSVMRRLTWRSLTLVVSVWVTSAALMTTGTTAAAMEPIGMRRVAGLRDDGVRERLRMRRERAFVVVNDEDVEDSDAKERWFAQKLDHFDGADSRVWMQRYFLNDAYVREGSKTTPIFVCVGGEGPALTPNVVVDGDVHCSVMIDLARKHSALVVALEHRFYGASQPTGDLSVGSLKYLSSAQALEDLAGFVAFVAAEYELTPTPRGDDSSAEYSKVVTFGGSYPGMLTAWSRVKYPHLIHAAVASSAPVRAEVDMRGYYDVVGDALRETDIGGSDECYEAVSHAFSVDLSKLLQTKSGRRSLETKFNLCGDKALDEFGGRDGFGEVLRAMFPAQNNDPSCGEDDPNCFNIAKACKTMTSNENKLDALAKHVSNVFQGACVALDGAEYMRELESTVPNPLGEGERQWTWQTCTEFAFFQTCEKDSRCPFKLDPPTMPLESYFWICGEVFGISAETVTQSVQRSNIRYGSDAPGGTRILFPSGSVDPWIANSFTSDGFAPKWEPAFVVPGASHHSWTHPPKDTDTEAVVDARKRIETRVDAWLKEGPMTRRFRRTSIPGRPSLTVM
jgi:serine protease 16